jgi:hypothetical protein
LPATAVLAKCWNPPTAAGAAWTAGDHFGSISGKRLLRNRLDPPFSLPAGAISTKSFPGTTRLPGFEKFLRDEEKAVRGLQPPIAAGLPAAGAGFVSGLML